MIKQTRCCAVRGAYPSPLQIVKTEKTDGVCERRPGVRARGNPFSLEREREIACVKIKILIIITLVVTDWNGSVTNADPNPGGERNDTNRDVVDLIQIYSYTAALLFSLN